MAGRLNLKDLKSRIKKTGGDKKSVIGSFSLKNILPSFHLPKPDVDGVGSLLLHWWHKIAMLVVLLLVLYYPIGAFLANNIDDNTDFVAAEIHPGASRTVATMAALIDREVNQNTWTANLPFFFPASVLDNMPNYQMGMITALSNFVLEYRDQLGRRRGSSSQDVDLDKAVGGLNYSGEMWIVDGIKPTASANSQYRKARKHLVAYNNRLIEGKAVYDKRADNLEATLDRISKDIGSLSQNLDTQITDGTFRLVDTEADDLFYRTKGRMYAYYLILRDLKADFANIIDDRNLTEQWDRMLLSFKQAAELDPLIVANGNVDGQFVPCHLTAIGFYLLRARTQMKETASILLR